MKRTLIGVVGLCLAQVASAQTPEQDVMRVVNQMFDGMRNADSAAVRALFVPGARFASIDPRATPPAVLPSSAPAKVFGRQTLVCRRSRQNAAVSSACSAWRCSRREEPWRA